MNARSIALLGLVIATFELGSSAKAQGPTQAETPAPDDPTAALIRRGIELRHQGNDEGALELFWQAWAINPQPRACAQLALAEQAVGSFAEAERHLVHALAAADDAWIARHRPDLELALVTIQSRLGSLFVRGGVTGAEVRIDGAPVGTLPMTEPIRLTAGRYRIDVSIASFYPVTRHVSIAPAQVASESIVLVPIPPPPEETRVPLELPARAGDRDGPPSSATRSVGVASVVAGGALLATSAAVFGVREHAAREYNSDGCLAPGATRGETCGHLDRRAVRAQRWSASMLGAGAALATVGAILLVVAPAPAGDGHDEARATRPACSAALVSTWGGECTWSF